jgi:hypothetical protein
VRSSFFANSNGMSRIHLHYIRAQELVAVLNGFLACLAADISDIIEIAVFCILRALKTERTRFCGAEMHKLDIDNHLKCERREKNDIGSGR